MNYIEYLQTDNYCWFDTGIIPTVNTEIEIVDFVPLTQTAHQYNVFIGSANTDWDSSCFGLRSNNTTRFAVRVGDAYKIASSYYTVGDTYRIILNKDTFTWGENTKSVATSSFITNNYSLWIGAEHNSNTGGEWETHRASAARYGEIIIRNNDVVVGDFLPAIDNGEIGFYDTISETFKSNLGTGTPVAGPIISSIYATADKQYLAAAGETIDIAIECENSWTVADSGNWLTLSANSGTGDTTITATAPSYSGNENRQTTLTFTDTTTNDTYEVAITQKPQLGQPVYLGGNEITELYLGSNTVSEAYLGTELVFSSGSFIGLRVAPSSLSFDPYYLTATITIKSSEAWTLTAPAWLTASANSGTAGTTTVTLTASELGYSVSSSIVVTAGSDTASVTASYEHSGDPVPANMTVVNIYDVETAGDTINILKSASGFSAMSVDGATEVSPTTTYTFDTAGEHTVTFTVSSTSLNNRNFEHCFRLVRSYWGDGPTYFGTDFYSGDSLLTTVKLPSTLTYSSTLLRAPFADNSSLTRIYGNSMCVDERYMVSGTTMFALAQGYTDHIIPEGVTECRQYTFRLYTATGIARSVTFPTTFTTFNFNMFQDRCPDTNRLVFTNPDGVTLDTSNIDNSGIASTGTIVIPCGSSANYSALLANSWFTNWTVEEACVTVGGYLSVNGAANIVTEFNPYTEYIKNNYLRIEINADWIANGYMFFAGRNPWFSYEKGIYGIHQYMNFGDVVEVLGGSDTNGFESTMVFTYDNGNATNSLGATNTYTSNPSNAVMTFFDSSYATSIQMNFYRMKVYNSANNLAYDFRAAEDENGVSCIYEEVSGTCIYPSGSGTITYTE